MNFCEKAQNNYEKRENIYNQKAENISLQVKKCGRNRIKNLNSKNATFCLENSFDLPVFLLNFGAVFCFFSFLLSSAAFDGRAGDRGGK